MVCRTKKSYKKIYIKRRSRKLMHGGINTNKPVTDIMNDIQKQNALELPSINEIPVVGPIIQNTSNLVEGAAVKAIDSVGDSIGVDIDNPQSINNKLNDVQEAISNPDNVQKTKEILSNAGKYGELLIEAAAPVIEKTADKMLPVITKEADKAMRSGLGTLVNIAEDVGGPIIGIPRTILSALEAFNASANAASSSIKAASEIVQGTEQNMERLQSNINPNVINQAAGGKLKKYNKEALMIGGRINKSRIEFLSSIKSQKIKKHINNNITRHKYR
jgi:hypothetical protein